MATKCPKCDFDNPDTVKFCGDCGTQLGQDIPEVTRTIETPAQELTRGTVFAGRYEIIEQLGIGGMDSVMKEKVLRMERRAIQCPKFSFVKLIWGVLGIYLRAEIT